MSSQYDLIPPHLFDYSKGYHSGQILNEWLAWIEAMAPFDNGMYD